MNVLVPCLFLLFSCVFSSIFACVMQGSRTGFITGRGCGSITPITRMDKLPEDPEEVAKLACVITPDVDGLRKRCNAKPS